MSLWKVPLEQTMTQMATLTKLWREDGMPRYQAFRESQLDALQRAREKAKTSTPDTDLSALRANAHPFHWAGFIYAGQTGD